MCQSLKNGDFLAVRCIGVREVNLAHKRQRTKSGLLKACSELSDFCLGVCYSFHTTAASRTLNG